MQILGEQDADNGIAVGAVDDRETGVFRIANHLEVLLRQPVDVQCVDAGAWNHHPCYLSLVELEQVAQHVGLLVMDFAVFLGGCNQAFEFLTTEHIGMGGLLYSEQRENRPARLVEEVVEWPDDQIARMQRVGAPDRDRLGLSDGKGFGNLLAHHDVQRRENQKAGYERGGVQYGIRNPQRMKHRLQQCGNRRFAHPAESKRCHGDTELAGGEIGLEIRLDAQCQPGGALPATAALSIRNPRALTSANSAATKKPFAVSSRMMTTILVDVSTR